MTNVISSNKSTLLLWPLIAGFSLFMFTGSLSSREKTEPQKCILVFGAHADDVADINNNRVHKFNTDLQFSGKWGTQESIGFKLYMPHEMAVSKDGNIVISDRQNHRISVFSKNGDLIKRFGDFGEGKDAKGNQFSEPHGVAVGENGDIFICDRYNFSGHKFNANGEFLTRWNTSGILDDSKHFPLGITVSGSGSIYITDHYSHCIQRY